MSEKILTFENPLILAETKFFEGVATPLEIFNTVRLVNENIFLYKFWFTRFSAKQNSF